MIIKFIRKWVGGLRYSTALLVTGLFIWITWVFITSETKDWIAYAGIWATYTGTVTYFIHSDGNKPAQPGA